VSARRRQRRTHPAARHAFRDIHFEYPYGFEPAASPFKLAVVHPDSVVLHIANPVSDGLTFKYTLTVKDLRPVLCS
jgi:hypothetical protein